jgi:competence protein ComFC
LIHSVRDRLAGAAKLFELAVFPSRCKICFRLLESPHESVLCRSCVDKIVPDRSPACPRCGRLFEGAGGPHLCAACLNAPPPFSCHRSGARYKGELKDAILLFKYRKYQPLGGPLARFLYDALRKEDAIWTGVDLVLPVPLHRRRRQDRGFNQAEVLAQALGGLAGLPCDAGVLKKTRNTPPQTTLEHNERRANVRGAYEVIKPENVRGKTILLVDDVYTTGSTLAACALALKNAGAGDMRAVTLAQA